MNSVMGYAIQGQGQFPGLCFFRKASPTSPPAKDFPVICGCQPMFRTDTTGTPTRIKRLHRAGVPAVPDSTVSSFPSYGAK